MLKILIVLTLVIFLGGCTYTKTAINPTPTVAPSPQAPTIGSYTSYQKIEVMGEPLAQVFTENDQQYKDGYAKFYTFSASKGQHLTILAQEDIKVNYSFIKTELYDEQGKLLYDRDTRIEFEVPYTGNYYYVVRTFENRTGAFVLKIFKPEQARNTVSVKLQNGDIKTLPETGETQSFTNVQGVIVQFVAPIELKDGNTVVYYDPGEEFRASFGVLELPIKVYVVPNINREQNVGSIRFSPNKENYRKEITISKIDTNKVLVEQKDKSIFEPNNIVVVEWVLDNKGSSYATGFYTNYP